VQGQNALNASIEASHLDQRAWVGVADFATIGGVKTLKGFSYKSVQFVIRNSGKTPAINLSAVTLETTRDWNEEIGDYDTFIAEDKRRREEMYTQLSEGKIRRPPNFSIDEMREWIKNMSNQVSLEEKKLFSAGQVLPPDSVMAQGVGGISYGNLRDGIPQVIYILGKITYNDIFDGTPLRTTKFCLERMDGTDFSICPKGNHMD
jgi:hypothetical protein